MSSILRFFGWSSLIIGILAGLTQGFIADKLISFWGIINFILTLFGGMAVAAIFFALSYMLEYLETVHQLLAEHIKKDQHQPKTAYPEKGKAASSNIFSDTTSKSEASPAGPAMLDALKLKSLD